MTLDGSVRQRQLRHMAKSNARPSTEQPTKRDWSWLSGAASLIAAIAALVREIARLWHP